MNAIVSSVLEKYRKHFQGEPLLVRSPGRVNLIGEHTDYSEGFVLPAAIDKAIIFAISPRPGRECVLHAADLDEFFSFPLEDLEKPEARWPAYLMGVVDQIQKTGCSVPAFQCAFGGDIPIGAGLSSSAALEAGLAFSLNRLFGLGLEPIDLVKLSQKAENEFVGVRCGIMDQFVNIFGRRGKVVKIDCRSLEHSYHPFEREGLRIVLCDTRVRRELASSEYNVRRRQCEEGVAVLRRHGPDIRSLRDVTRDLLEEHRVEFEPVVYNRCLYVVQENERVEAACRDLAKEDYSSFGRRMFASHEGLRGLYEVSSPELDILVEEASGIQGVLGSRMMGAGFGGCTISLVEDSGLESFRERISREYGRRMGKEAIVYACSLSSGTEVAGDGAARLSKEEEC